MMEPTDIRRSIDRWILREQPDICEECPYASECDGVCDPIIIELKCVSCGEWHDVFDVNPVNGKCWRCDVHGC